MTHEPGTYTLETQDNGDVRLLFSCRHGNLNAISPEYRADTDEETRNRSLMTTLGIIRATHERHFPSPEDRICVAHFPPPQEDASSAFSLLRVGSGAISMAFGAPEQHPAWMIVLDVAPEHPELVRTSIFCRNHPDGKIGQMYGEMDVKQLGGLSVETGLVALAEVCAEMVRGAYEYMLDIPGVCACYREVPLTQAGMIGYKVSEAFQEKYGKIV